MRVETSVPVLVLRSARHGGVGVARSLGRLGVPVYVLDRRADTPVFSSRYCAGRFVWDLDRGKTPAAESVDYLERAACRIGGRAILIATTDDTAMFVAEHAGTPRTRGHWPWSWRRCCATARWRIAWDAKHGWNI